MDGCAGGWMAAWRSGEKLVLKVLCTEELAGLLQHSQLRCAVIDIPIGLSDRAPRACDAEARRLLGWPRSSSVFSAPIRPTLATSSYAAALELTRSLTGRGLSIQSYHLLAKIRAVDEMLDAVLCSRVHEGHPELALAAMAGAPLLTKHSRPGRLQRIELLERQLGAGASILRDSAPRQEDAIDAAACLQVARRITEGAASHVPSGCLQTDRRGLPMTIWY